MSPSPRIAPRITRRTARWTAAAFALSIVLAGCGGDKPLDTLNPEGSKAKDIDNLIKPIFIIAIVVFIIVCAVFGAIVMKFRADTPEDSDALFDDEKFPVQSHGNAAVEAFMTFVPAVLLLVIGVLTVITLLDLDDVAAAPESSTYPEMKVNVVGQQWWWEYQYHLDGNTDTAPDFVTATDLVIPVKQEIRIYTTSRDVIHSFWIPKLNGKKDAVPGRVHPWVIQSDKIGRFAGQCTEFCGLSHGWMKMYAVAVTMDDFDEWVGLQTTDKEPLVEGDDLFEGQELFINNCARCHVVNGVTGRDHDDDPETDDRADDWAMYGSIDEYHGVGATYGRYSGEVNLTAGAAPNLTHFASRSSYAGAFFELYADAQDLSDAGKYLDLAVEGDVQMGQLEAWILNPAGEKPNAADDMRGMPNLGLNQTQVDELIAYLLSLD